MISISSSEPNSQSAEDFTSVDIIGYNNEFHITYLDYNTKTLYFSIPKYIFDHFIDFAPETEANTYKTNENR